MHEDRNFRPPISVTVGIRLCAFFNRRHDGSHQNESGQVRKFPSPVAVQFRGGITQVPRSPATTFVDRTMGPGTPDAYKQGMDRHTTDNTSVMSMKRKRWLAARVVALMLSGGGLHSCSPKIGTIRGTIAVRLRSNIPKTQMLSVCVHLRLERHGQCFQLVCKLCRLALQLLTALFEDISDRAVHRIPSCHEAADCSLPVSGK